MEFSLVFITNVWVAIYHNVSRVYIYTYLNGVHSASRGQLRSYFEERIAVPVQETENTAGGILHADHVTPSNPEKLALTSPTSGSRSVGIVRSLTEATEFVSFVCIYIQYIYIFEGSKLRITGFEGFIHRP
jgi:hypothetical protein